MWSYNCWITLLSWGRRFSSRNQSDGETSIASYPVRVVISSPEVSSNILMIRNRSNHRWIRCMFSRCLGDGVKMASDVSSLVPVFHLKVNDLSTLSWKRGSQHMWCSPPPHNMGGAATLWEIQCICIEARGITKYPTYKVHVIIGEYEIPSSHCL